MKIAIGAVFGSLLTLFAVKVLPFVSISIGTLPALPF